MANYRLLIPHMIKWEGGLSADPEDTASSYPSTYKMPYNPYKGKPVHTNKGITFKTWVSTSKELGHPSNTDAFIKMTDAQWGKVMKKFYWDVGKGDSMNSQIIAELLTEIMWGSGNGGLKPNVILMQNFLKKKGYDPQGVDGVIGTNTINALNSYLSKTGKAGEKELYDAIWNNRVSQLRTYGTFYKHGQGWLNRMNDLYKSALTKATELIANNPIKTGLFSAFLIVGGLFLLGKKYAK